MFNIADQPGLLFVVATFLPLASFTLLLLWAGLRWALRPHAREGGAAAGLFEALGGAVPGRGPAIVALAAIALAFACSATGFVMYLGEYEANHETVHRLEGEIHKLDDAMHEEGADETKIHEQIEANKHEIEVIEARWQGSVEWAALHHSSKAVKDPGSATSLRVGFYIDMLAAIMFVMVTFIATLIHLFSMGYMHEELERVVADHEVHTEEEGGHLHRRGRFGRFFMFLSLFCFSMLNLLLADNLFQVFVSWELVGVCSFLLIGFYLERTSATNAANKAFITNRIGDAGFIIGLLIVWTHLGTFNFQEMFQRVRAPQHDAHHAVVEHDSFILVEREKPIAGGQQVKIQPAGQGGSDVLLFPRKSPHLHFDGAGAQIRAFDTPNARQYSIVPYWMLVVAGLGIFLGCVGKSAQFPLQVWLPDAMEGPTPVSALIHAATMVAAGVYLVGRCYPLFLPEVLLTIAYTGGITLFVAATIAIVMTDIKKVLAYSTVSQLGYMMLALGVGGWTAGLFHLLTHAFFKALLFLGSGSVIYGCHHEQDMTRMGGLYPKMKITALSMLMGVLAISGIPLFSGWYSKDAVLASALSFVTMPGKQQHFLLFLLPLVTAGITTFYMFRMWFLTFTGEPRDHHVYDHAHESPWMMTLPLVLLAALSVGVAWGIPHADEHGHMQSLAEASWLEHQLHHSQPPSVDVDFPVTREEMHHNHELAGYLALGMVAIGLAFAVVLYLYRALDPADAVEQFPGVYRFLQRKWYFDELYSVALVRPALVVAHWCRWFDANVIDGFVNGLARVNLRVSTWSGRFDRGIVDGLVNLLADVSYGVGAWLRTWQTGYLRSYVLFLVLAAVGIWILVYFMIGGPAGAGQP